MELAPIDLPEQLAVLEALAAGLFDAVPLDALPAAEAAVRAAAAGLAPHRRARLASAAPSREEDRRALQTLAREALAKLGAS